MEEKTCCVTGHRDIPADQIAYVNEALRREIHQAIADGYTCFLSGFAEGADQIFAGIVAHLRQSNGQLRLEAAIPYEKRYQRLSASPNTASLLKACAAIHVISEKYAPNVYMLRNRYMVSHSGRVIAVYDGRATGGTAATMRLAIAQQREVRKIRIGSSLSC